MQPDLAFFATIALFGQIGTQIFTPKYSFKPAA